MEAIYILEIYDASYFINGTTAAFSAYLKAEELCRITGWDCALRNGITRELICNNSEEVC